MSGKKLQERLGYSFSDVSLLRLALTHPSYGAPNNQRLEFLGDAVLQLCISEKLYDENPEAPEGKLTRQRALLVQERSLYSAALRLDIGGSLILGKGELVSGGNLRPSILADAMEAIIGAIFLDSGLDAARSFVKHMLLNIDSSEWRDYKTELQEFVQAQGKQMPTYEIICSEGPAHDIRITAAVFIDGRRMGVGKGKSRKDADQAAARQALNELGSQD
ncbi:MAG: ribonuclease III [Christensenellales bacterium]|jgi:ribonuclease-3